LGLGQRAGFKRPEVALDGLFGLGCLGVGEGQLLLMVGALAFGTVPCTMDCPFDEVAALIGSAQGSGTASSISSAGSRSASQWATP
jgi:hypothetical protein